MFFCEARNVGVAERLVGRALERFKFGADHGAKSFAWQRTSFIS